MTAALSLNELCALHNLAGKHAGQHGDWINIAHARALTALGLARPTASGWEITREGEAAVQASPEAPGRCKWADQRLLLAGVPDA